MIAFDAISDRLARGQPLAREDAEGILAGRDLIAIGMLADEVRRRMHGTRTTFVRVFEVHVEVKPGRPPAGLQAGEIRIAGTPASADEAVAAVRAAVNWRRGAPVLGFSLADLWARAGAEGGFEQMCRSLGEAGLAGVSELPLDRFGDPATAVRAARRSGLRVERITVETLAAEDRIALLVRARELQDGLGGFRALAPLARVTPAGLPTTGYDDVKQVALARMMVPTIPSIQVDWRLHGPKLAQVALTMGADDVDGIDAVDEGVLGIRRTALAEILGNIRAAGLEPAERDGLFQLRG